MRFQCNHLLLFLQGFRALHAFRAKHGALPEPGNTEHAEAVLQLALSINNSNSSSANASDSAAANGHANGAAAASNSAASEGGAVAAFVADGLNEDKEVASADVIRAMARTARGVMSPMCAAIGGVVGE